MGEIIALSTDQVSKVTGVSLSQLRYWDRTALFGPGHRSERSALPFGRVYSFRDLVGLRVLGTLRNRHRVPLQTLRKVDEYLRKHFNDPWSSLTFYVRGREVFFRNPGTDGLYAGRTGQQTIPIELEEIARETRAAVDSLKTRRPEDVGRITRNRYVVHNTPVLAGTRIPTSSIRDFHEAGYSPEEILRQYPTLSPEDIGAALEYEESFRDRRRAG